MNGVELARMTDDEWRGYITGILEGLKGDVQEIKSDQKECNKKIGSLDKRTATIGGTIALGISVVGTLLGTFIKHLMGGN